MKPSDMRRLLQILETIDTHTPETELLAAAAKKLAYFTQTKDSPINELGSTIAAYVSDIAYAANQVQELLGKFDYGEDATPEKDLPGRRRRGADDE